MAERVFRILTKLSKNLTDRADKASRARFAKRIHQAACIRLPPDVPVSKFVD